MSVSAHFRAITLLSCAAFASSSAIRICDPMLPEIADAFGASTGQAAGTITSFAVTYGCFQLLYGPLGDRFSKYRLIAGAVLACIIGNVIASTATSLGMLIFARALAGATAAAIIPLSMAWIGDTVPYEQRQATLARFISGTILGIIGGQFLGGFVADVLGWRWCFIILSVIYLVVGILLQYEINRKDSICCHIGDISLPRNSFAKQFLDVLKIRWARIILVTVFLESMATFGSLAFIPSYLHQKFGISLTAAGAIIAVFGLGGLGYTFLAERLLCRFGEKGLVMAGGPFLGISFLLFLAVYGWYIALPASLIAGFGFYLLHNTLQTNATQMAPSSRGTAVAIFAASFFMGQSVGVGIGSIVIDTLDIRWLFSASALMLPAIGIGFAHVLKLRDSSLQ